MSKKVELAMLSQSSKMTGLGEYSKSIMPSVIGAVEPWGTGGSSRLSG